MMKFDILRKKWKGWRLKKKDLILYKVKWNLNI